MLAKKVLQHKVFLGHVKLSEFLGAVEFDGDGVALDGAVVGAWAVCAVKDRMAEEMEIKFGM